MLRPSERKTTLQDASPFNAHPELLTHRCQGTVAPQRPRGFGGSRLQGFHAGVVFGEDSTGIGNDGSAPCAGNCRWPRRGWSWPWSAEKSSWFCEESEQSGHRKQSPANRPPRPASPLAAAQPSAVPSRGARQGSARGAAALAAPSSEGRGSARSRSARGQRCQSRRQTRADAGAASGQNISEKPVANQAQTSGGFLGKRRSSSPSVG